MTLIFIVSGTSWTVPADWNSADNSIETIGGGGGGGTSSGGNDAGGGGAGAYSKITNLSLMPGANVTLQIGSVGLPNTSGGDAWFNGAALAESSVGSKGGGGASGPIGGAGGDQASGTGSVKFSGGNGGSSTNTQNGGAGGGGAAGPNGAGKAGALSGGNIGSGGGGAGGGSSTPGSDGLGGAGGLGGDGPEGHATAPGGTGAVAGSSTAVAGVHGSGGGGGASGSAAAEAAGATGGDGVEFDGTRGSGGGGGGSGYLGASDANGGAGGMYGGGGGGTAFAPGIGIGGNGGPGIIVINYTPITSSAVTADTWSPVEIQTTAFADGLNSIQFLTATRSAASPQTEELRATRADPFSPFEFTRLTGGDMAVNAEFYGALAVAVDAASRIEWTNVTQFDMASASEFGIRILQTSNNTTESLARCIPDWGSEIECLAPFVMYAGSALGWSGSLVSSVELRLEGLQRFSGNAGIPLNMLTVLGYDTFAAVESLSSGVHISASGLLVLEWADPPAAALVSLERLLRSPGKIRILSVPGSKHPLRDQ